jgi:hypothetical protein
MGKSWDSYRPGEAHEPPRRKGLKTLAIVAALMAIMMLPAMAAKGSGNDHGGSGGRPGGSGGVPSKVITDAGSDART